MVVLRWRRFFDRSLMEGPSRPEHHRGGQRTDDPLPATEPQRRNHGDQDHRHGQDGGDDQPPEQVGLAPFGGLVGGAVVDQVVAESLDGLAELGAADGGRVANHGAAGGEVDVGLGHTVEVGELALDAVGAGGAGHAVDQEIGANRGWVGVDGIATLGRP